MKKPAAITSHQMVTGPYMQFARTDVVRGFLVGSTTVTQNYTSSDEMQILPRDESVPALRVPLAWAEREGIRPDGFMLVHENGGLEFVDSREVLLRYTAVDQPLTTGLHKLGMHGSLFARVGRITGKKVDYSTDPKLMDQVLRVRYTIQCWKAGYSVLETLRDSTPSQKGFDGDDVFATRRDAEAADVGRWVIEHPISSIWRVIKGDSYQQAIDSLSKNEKTLNELLDTGYLSRPNASSRF